MPKLTRDASDAREATCQPQESPRDHLTDYLLGWQRRNRQRTLPAPMPATATDAADWWLNVMAPKPPDLIPGDDHHNARLIGAYCAETRSALRGFLAMTDRERMTVVGVCGDNRLAMTYRGERFKQFLDIANEADLYADDPARYRARLAARAKATLARVAALSNPHVFG